MSAAKRVRVASSVGRKLMSEPLEGTCELASEWLYASISKLFYPIASDAHGRDGPGPWNTTHVWVPLYISSNEKKMAEVNTTNQLMRADGPIDRRELSMIIDIV